MESENELVENYVQPPEKKLYLLQNPPTVNYNYGRPNLQSIGWNNLIVGYHVLRNVSNACVNVVNSIAAFFEPTPPTSIIKNDTTLTQYSIKQGLKCFGKKFKATLQK